ncbi:MAG: hypothetical protein FWE86_00405, partial [Oscillospiraceae bacterium]|nr:hypothetical protein [Oscillospiraceae bacterium]
MNNNPKNNRSTNRYKSLFTFAASSLLLAAISVAYWWVWIEYYSENIVQPFWTKGHVLLFLVYFVLLLLLTNIYGSQGITAKRIWDVIYTHALSLLLTNVITYFQICLLTVKMVPVLPLALMTLADVGLIAIWAIGTKTLYRTLFPPSRLIVVYDDYDPSDTVDKLSKMNDQYIIGETISVSGGLQPVYRAMRDYDGVVLCDVHASDKSEIVKNCYKND